MKLQYPAIPKDAEDNESHARNLDALKDEATKSKPRHDVLKALMARTFPKRREWVLSGAVSVNNITSEWPMLKKSNYVSILVLLFSYACIYTLCRLHKSSH